MKIMFLCGSLQPGRDGVGDYTRRLAAELIIQKHSAAIIALYENGLEQTTEEEQYSDQVAVPVFRLPASLHKAEKEKTAFQWIKDFNPQIISLQYVSFSFHPKGMPFGLSNFLTRIGGGRKWTIMFHELWLVSQSSFPSKRNIIGAIQKFLITRLIKKVKPAVIYTQSQLSAFQLSKLGFTVSILPLFSNIPVSGSPNLFDRKQKQDNPVTLVSFGSVYPNALIDRFAKEAAAYQQKTGTTIVLLIAGRSGNLQQHWIDVWTAAGLTTKSLGELSAQQVSTVLTSATAGLSSTPFVMSEKSGAVAAMREHGLPVICIADPYTPKGFQFHPPNGLIEFSRVTFEDCISLKADRPHDINVSVVARQFANELKAIN